MSAAGGRARREDFICISPCEKTAIEGTPRESGSFRLAARSQQVTHNRLMGTFVLALHSHLPYCRGAGRWPHGEEWIHEAVLGTYLPLLVLLHDLRDAGVPYRIVIGLTPILIEQLADRDINVRTLEYIDDQVLRAEKDVRRFTDAPAQGRAELANFYVGSYRRLREAYRTRFGRDLVGAFADLAKTGHVEILTSAATHGYLPLLEIGRAHV